MQISNSKNMNDIGEEVTESLQEKKPISGLSGSTS